jgi:hypothetical protein
VSNRRSRGIDSSVNSIHSFELNLSIHYVKVSAISNLKPELCVPELAYARIIPGSSLRNGLITAKICGLGVCFDFDKGGTFLNLYPNGQHSRKCIYSKN